jgi:hypothetical protein
VALPSVMRFPLFSSCQPFHLFKCLHPFHLPIFIQLEFRARARSNQHQYAHRCQKAWSTGTRDVLMTGPSHAMSRPTKCEVTAVAIVRFLHVRSQASSQSSATGGRLLSQWYITVCLCIRSKRWPCSCHGLGSLLLFLLSQLTFAETLLLVLH